MQNEPGFTDSYLGYSVGETFSIRESYALKMATWLGELGCSTEVPDNQKQLKVTNELGIE
jgi:hypothetical protein